MATKAEIRTVWETAMTQRTLGYITEKQALQNRLRRVEGQIRGLQRMVDEHAYCN